MSELVEFLDKAETRFKNAPVGMLFEKEKSYAVQLFAQNEFLKKTAMANPLSLLSAMSNVASIGLSLNPAKKQAYLVPRGGAVCLDPSYMGMCDLATQSGMIEFVQAKIVREKDKYVNRGIDKEPLHEYEAFGDRGKIVGAYCVAKTAKGDYLTTEMDKAKLDDIKSRSELGKKGKGPWFTDEEEMSKKSVIRLGFKTWPKTETMERLELAVELSNQNEQFEPLITSPELRSYSEDQKKYFDSLIEKSDAIGIYCFLSGIDEGVYTSLYNSFEKGSIGKYKTIVSKLMESGRNQVTDIRIAVSDAMKSGDDMAAKEVLCDLSKEVIDFIVKDDSDLRRFADECLRELAA